MCKVTDLADAPTDANVPHTRVPLAHYAELQETIDRLDSSLGTATANATAYKAALIRILELCPDTDAARSFVGDVARATLFPAVTAPKLNLETSK